MTKRLIGSLADFRKNKALYCGGFGEPFFSSMQEFSHEPNIQRLRKMFASVQRK